MLNLLLLAACQGNTDAPVDTAAADADTDTDTDSDTDTDTDADTDTDTDIRDLTPVPLGDCVGDLGTFDTLLPSWSRALAELDGAPARILVGDSYLVVIGGSTVAVYDYAPSALLDTDVTLRWSAPLGATVVDVAIETTFARVATIDADNQIQLFALADGAVGPTHDGSADPAYTTGIVTLDADDLTVVESSFLVDIGAGQLDGNAASPAAFLVDDTFLGAFPWDGSAGSGADLPGGVDLAVAPDDTFLFTVSDDGALQRWGCWAE